MSALAWRGVAVRRRVVVNLEGQAFSGVLYRVRGPLLVLRDAKLHLPGQEAQAVDGEVVVERSKVEWVQVLNGGGD